MKNRLAWLAISAAVVAGGACKKKEDATVAGVPAAVEKAADKVIAVITRQPEAPGLTADERALKLGFMKYLPKDTEVVMSFHNGSKAAERVKASKLWKLVESQMTGGNAALEEAVAPAAEEEVAEAGVDEAADAVKAAADAVTADSDAVIEAAEPALPAAADAKPANDAVEPPEKSVAAAAAPEEAEIGPALMLGSEVTLAFGKSTGEQVSNLLTLNRRSSYFQMRGLALAFVAAAKSGDQAKFLEVFANRLNKELITEILKDPKSGMAAIEKAQISPIYLAFKVEESKRAAAAQQLSGMLSSAGMLGEMVEPAETEQAGQKFKGYQLSGKKLSEQMASDRETMDQMIGAATVDQLLAALAKKNMVVMTGTLGEHVVLFIGSSKTELNFAASAGESLLATDALKFSDSYKSKELAAVIYAQKEASEQITAAGGGLADMTEGLRDGIAGSDGLGDTRDIEAMFQIVAEREAAMMKLVSQEATGVMAFFEEGLKIESFGGADRGVMAWKTPNKLARLGDSADTVLFANMNIDDGYDAKARAYFEALLETAYALTMKVAEVPTQNAEILKMKETIKMVDGKFRPDLLALWNAYSTDLGGALGGESALLIDLKGTAPAIPGIPQALIDKAKLPRVSWIKPVTDRAKLSASWDKMQTASTSILAKISEMTGQNIPMQKPLSSDKSGLTTWFFPIPFLTEDFMPSVTVGDQWLAASTSKNQALDLIAQANAGGEVGYGFQLMLNFKALQTYAENTLKMIEENPDLKQAVMSDPEALEKMKAAISAFGDLDKFSHHSYLDGSQMRSSSHFKTR
jgi:hypothetical protein